MAQSLIAFVQKWINAFPSKNEISSTMSPAVKVKGKGDPTFNHKRITFGSYTIVYNVTTNGIKRRSVPSISLNETNDRGGYYFMSLVF